MTIKSNKHLIFVYGTLKRGWGNNVIIHDQEFLGNAITCDSKFQMYSLGGYPGVVAGEEYIHGEVWSVDDVAFARCDRLEGNPTFYKRKQIKVFIRDSNDVTTCRKVWIYIYQGDVSNRQPIKEWVH